MKLLRSVFVLLYLFISGLVYAQDTRPSIGAVKDGEAEITYSTNRLKRNIESFCTNLRTDGGIAKYSFEVRKYDADDSYVLLCSTVNGRSTVLIPLELKDGKLFERRVDNYEGYLLVCTSSEACDPHYVDGESSCISGSGCTRTITVSTDRRVIY